MPGNGSGLPLAPAAARHAATLWRKSGARARWWRSGIDETAKPLNLALQGGGSHGALTWGVLDRLLEDERIEIVETSGTSAGAMNAVVLADGYAAGGREGARAALAAFWKAVSDAARFSPAQRTWWDRMSGRYSLDRSPGYLMMEGIGRLFSPYELNPFDLNPLRDLLVAQVDFARVNAPGGIVTHVNATNVRTGLPRVFYDRRDHRRHGAGLGLPAADVQGGGDRRRGLLGRRLLGQPGALSRWSRTPRARTS